jgi:ribonuclease VapC
MAFHVRDPESDSPGRELARRKSASGTGAVRAHARYGKGSGQPARLNLGDCFACGVAKQHGVTLPYEGDDFSRTDLA